jgi:acyl-CoA synthetase (AMP-forming)/AMP-acid ligase II/thioesterase domain-containing protein
MQLLTELFEHAVPSATALGWVDGQSLPYGDLASLAARNRAFLRSRGLGIADRVAILAPNGPEAAVAFLTVAAASASAPLNPAYSAREFEFFLNDLRPGALLVAAGLRTPATDIARRLGIDVLDLDPGSGAISAETPASRTASPDGAPGPGDVALLLHTSGTTARPKLVPLTQRNLCASARNIAATLQLTPADRCLNVMPLFHIHGLVGAVLSSLSAGAAVICAPGLLVHQFFDWLDQHEPTWYTAVPTMHQSILTRCAGQPHRLRCIRSSSAALPPSVMAALEQAFGVPVLESYGMTEAAHQMASNPMPPAPRKPGSVGKAAGPEVRIAGGEVEIRGENVTAGYASNPEANAAAFSDDGWFRTGDQGYFDEDGYLFLTGRIKELINRGGEKIAPREIDEALLEHPDIQQAVAFAVPHARLGEDVGVAVVARAGVVLTTNDVIEFAATRLADFKVPRIVRIVSEVPRGPTGKVQRIGLAAALGVGAIEEKRSGIAATPPRSDVETGLHEIWSDVLRATAFGIHDEFASLGGDSLSAAEVAVRVTGRFGIQIPFVTFRTTPTIAGMADAIGRIARAGVPRITQGLIPLKSDGSRAPLYCVAGHGGLLLEFAGLAQHLDRPMLAFEPPVGGPQTIESLAARYLDVLKAHQPKGPYHLMGHCFGGFVAYEMACQLADQGEPVPHLTLIESFHPQWMRDQSVTRRAWIRVAHLFRRARFHAGNLVGGTSPLAYVRQRYARLQRDRREDAAQALANRASVRAYRPRVYRGRVLIVAPTDPRAGRYPAPLLGWRGLIAGPVENVAVSDRLQGLLREPAVVEVAAVITRHSSHGA